MADQSENLSKLESEKMDSRHFVKSSLARNSRVHCIVNEAAIQLTANVLLAIGFEPSMTSDVKEANPLVESSDALSINLGMLSETKRIAISEAVNLARQRKIPWVLDPVFIDRSEPRAKFCQELIQFRPTAIRANKKEINTICSLEGRSAKELSREFDVVLIETDYADKIVFSDRTVELDTGHPWMSQVTGMGCALSAIVAAYVIGSEDPFTAVRHAVANYGFAGFKAAQLSQGPGTFVPNFLDQLSNLHE